MIVVACEQGSPEWVAARLGVVTASEFDNILTAKTLKPSAQAQAYLCRLVAETILGVPVETDGNSFMERGKELEPEAANLYAMLRDVEPETVGFVLRDDRRLGASPDRLIGKDGGLEIKCPLAHNHVANLLDPDGFRDKHRTQVQVSMLVTGRSYWDSMSYNPVMPPVIVRSEPDAAWRKAAEPALADFLARMDEALSKVYAAGVTPASANPFL